MGMATFTDKQDQVKRIFATKINLMIQSQKTENCKLNTFVHGMSGDYNLPLRVQ
jgi:uncharacterized pyridoxal phosphate-containing UPF0001 family protein